MECECPKGKKAFTEGRPPITPVEGQCVQVQGQHPDTLQLVDLHIITSVTWNVAVYTKASIKKASGSLSDIFIPTLYCH